MAWGLGTVPSAARATLLESPAPIAWIEASDGRTSRHTSVGGSKEIDFGGGGGKHSGGLDHSESSPKNSHLNPVSCVGKSDFSAPHRKKMGVENRDNLL